MADRPSGSMSGLSDEEAKEFHSLFVFGFTMFTAIAAVAHFLVWLWRPWFPSVRGYASLSDPQTLAAITQLVL